ncbi:hypothetical protein [Myroides odoratus]|uniref:hypothetical protein n=1 Tax=Myroides odoratus TaxID=256 RepID=UPI0039AF82C9
MKEIKELLMLITRLEHDTTFAKNLFMSPNGARKNRIFYMKLSSLLSNIYDKEQDKLDWLKREFRQLKDRNSDIFQNEDKEFNVLYAQSGFKFNSIPYYFERKKYKNCFDIASFIVNLFHETDVLIDKARIISLMCCSTAMFTALKKNQDTLDLILLVAEYFYKLDIANGTFMSDVNYYITFECTKEEIEWMKKASPIYFISFYNQKRSIDD